MTTLKTAFLLAGLLVGNLLPAQTITDQKSLAAELDVYTRQLLEKVAVIPGIAIAVVTDKGTILVKGYGWADKEQSLAADENTLFYIASSTKSFTGLAAALLDHEKKIMLNADFRNYLQGKQFQNEIGNQVTIRDLLTHTSGLDNGPLTFRLAYSGAADTKDMFRLLQDATSPKHKYGVYKYDNLGYNIYALVLENHLQKKWQDVLAEKIFTPLGMKRTTAYMSLAQKNKWTVAEPYSAYGEKGLTKLYLHKQDNTMQSAGGLVSTASDLASWLQVQLNNGKLGNKQIFPAEVMRTTHTGYAPYEKDGNPFNAAGAYGLGWLISQYRNEKIIYHFGGFPGFRSHISFMPDKKIGIAVLANEGTIGSVAADILATYVYDRLTNMEDHANVYTKKLDELMANDKRASEGTQRAYADRAKRTWQLSLPLESYTGKYIHPYLGEMLVSVENNALAVKIGNLHAVSTPYTQKESIRVELIPGTGQVVLFKMDETQKVNTATYDGQDFRRQ